MKIYFVEHSLMTSTVCYECSITMSEEHKIDKRKLNIRVQVNSFDAHFWKKFSIHICIHYTDNEYLLTVS